MSNTELEHTFDYQVSMFCRALALTLTDRVKGKVVVIPNTETDTYVISVELKEFKVCEKFNNLTECIYLGYDKEALCETFIKRYRYHINNCFFK